MCSGRKTARCVAVGRPLFFWVDNLRGRQAVGRPLKVGSVSLAQQTLSCYASPSLALAATALAALAAALAALAAVLPLRHCSPRFIRSADSGSMATRNEA